MNKRVSAALLSFSIAGFLALGNLEGYENHVYIPIPGDNPTGGFGHMDPRLPVGAYVSEKQAVQWLTEDTREAQNAVKRCVKVPLSQNEFDAYVSFAYNVGETAFCRSTLVKKLNGGQYEQACDELKKWVYSGGVKYKGLITRRNIENLICKTGQYPMTPEWLERFRDTFTEISK